jgi:hypothetical protein
VGYATQAELKAVEDKLRVQFGHGWASGDPNIEGLNPGRAASRAPHRRGDLDLPFHPAYYVDYIFFRRILTRVEGAYYFRPSVEYDFVRNPTARSSVAARDHLEPRERVRSGARQQARSWRRARSPALLPVEGWSLNDDPAKMGGFYSALQYGVFFPLGGLDYLPGERGDLPGPSRS